MVYVCDAQKTTMDATDMVSVDATVASALSDLESISSLKEEQRMTLKLFLHGINVFSLLLSDFCMSLIYQVASLIIEYIELIGRGHTTIDNDRQMVYPINCQVFFLKCLPFSK